MKIVCISDLHGRLPERIPECDVLTIAGDTCPTYSHERGFQRQWLETEFNDWLKDQPAKDKVMVAGNHDFIFEDVALHGAAPVKLDCHYLCDSGVEIDDIKFWGHPWSPMFCQWAFMLYNYNGDGDLYKKSLTIPEDTNVLISHSPPYGILDKIEGVDIMVSGVREREYLGSKPLKKRLLQLKDLKLHTFGHIHSSSGIQKIGNVTYVNASLLDEEYKMVYKAKEIEI